MNAPKPCGKKVDTCMFVDSDHSEANVSSQKNMSSGNQWTLP